MFKSLLTFCSLILVSYIAAQEKHPVIYNFDEFQPTLLQDNDTVYVINFWATWCRPCVEELPYFEQLNENYSDQKVKVILVSLDFFEDLNSRLIPFLEKRNIKSKVILLNESNPNDYVDKISPEWSGAIPATLIYKASESDFFEMNFKYEELDSIVKLKLN